MAELPSIKAGGAFIKLVLDDASFEEGLKNARKILRAFSAGLKELDFTRAVWQAGAMAREGFSVSRPALAPGDFARTPPNSPEALGVRQDGIFPPNEARFERQVIFNGIAQAFEKMVLEARGAWISAKDAPESGAMINREFPKAEARYIENQSAADAIRESARKMAAESLAAQLRARSAIAGTANAVYGKAAGNFGRLAAWQAESLEFKAGDAQSERAARAAERTAHLAADLLEQLKKQNEKLDDIKEKIGSDPSSLFYA